MIMGQQSLIYSFVAWGTMILDEHTDFTENFAITLQCLQRLLATNTKFTYNSDDHTFNIILAHDGFTYCVVAVKSFGHQIAMAILERVKEDFTKRYGGGKAATATANSLNKEFGPKLKKHMQYCVDHQEEVRKLAKVKARFSEVQQVMKSNIDQI